MVIAFVCLLAGVVSADGMVVANGAITYRRAKTLAAQLSELGVKPDDVTYVAVSHTHGDHVGNVALLPASTVLIQARNTIGRWRGRTSRRSRHRRSSRSCPAITMCSATAP
jgi:glyoxylase-like metal-dependent hydrolase (beta-lactamase superfamily II)